MRDRRAIGAEDHVWKGNRPPSLDEMGRRDPFSLGLEFLGSGAPLSSRVHRGRLAISGTWVASKGGHTSRRWTVDPPSSCFASISRPTRRVFGDVSASQRRTKHVWEGSEVCGKEHGWDRLQPMGTTGSQQRRRERK